MKILLLISQIDLKCKPDSILHELWDLKLLPSYLSLILFEEHTFYIWELSNMLLGPWYYYYLLSRIQKKLTSIQIWASI